MCGTCILAEHEVPINDKNSLLTGQFESEIRSLSENDYQFEKCASLLVFVSCEWVFSPDSHRSGTAKVDDRRRIC